MKTNERLQALKILSALIQKKGSLSSLLPSDASPLTKELCFGVCRHYFRLEKLADRFLEKRPKDREVWVILLLGLYQLQYLRIPDYAAIKETVDLVGKVRKSSARGLVNAVLRRFCRELEKGIVHHHGHPEWLKERIQADWPDEWEKILEANDAHAPMTLRVKTKTRPQDAVKKLTPLPVQEIPGFAEGLVSVQDEAAQQVVPLLDLKPGLTVLDACCAPGGKTAQILETEPDLAQCIALDLHEHRLQRVRENLTRLKLTDRCQLLQGDALKPDTWWNGTPFDRILLDAPCSATGVIRRHPDIKLLRTDDQIHTSAQLQYQLLKTLWPLLKPNGLLVYSTCSILKEENDAVIQRFLNEEKQAHTKPIQLPVGRATQHGWQILPGEGNMDGFYYSVLTPGPSV